MSQREHWVSAQKPRQSPVPGWLDLKDAAHSGRGGAIYAVDLFGSGLGALLIGLWALPVLGAGTTLAILAALNGIVAMGMEKARRAD